MGAFVRLRITSHHEDVLHDLEIRSEQALHAVAEFLAIKIKIEIGLMYPPPSLPGEPPRSRKGDLQRGIGVITEGSGMEQIAHVGSFAPHSIYLELGTRKMAARPFMVATAKKYRAEMAQVAREALKK